MKNHIRQILENEIRRLQSKIAIARQIHNDKELLTGHTIIYAIDMSGIFNEDDDPEEERMNPGEFILWALLISGIIWIIVLKVVT